MKIVADENIPFVQQAFGRLGEVKTVAGHFLCRADTADADMLLVRAKTRIDGELLRGTPVRFVGSAGIGLDHVDRLYLRGNGIDFAYAPGSNATAVAEYIISALLVTAERRGFEVQDKRVGIIGCGNVGMRVRSRLQALGATCVINDPPRHAHEHNAEFVGLAEVLKADIISMHVPLEKGGQWPTAHLANADFFAALKPDAVFINTALGAVMDESALRQKLKDCPEFTAILDVWRNEPHFDTRLQAQAAIATPHIAGYSLDGRIRATEMLYRAACKHLDWAPVWSAQAALPEPPLQLLEFSARASAEQILHSAVMACYDVRRDDAALRRVGQYSDPGAYFGSLRKNYPLRREFANVRVVLPAGHEKTHRQLEGLGFRVED